MPAAGDSKTFTMQIDHSLYPEAWLFIFPYGGIGECTVNVAGVGSHTLRTRPATSSTVFDLKGIFTIKGADGVKDYTVTVSTPEGNAGCGLVLTAKDTFAATCGGEDNAASIRKNEATDYGVTYFSGYRPLLTGAGEWFRYTADGETYICARAAEMDDLKVTVYDVNTGEIFADTKPEDREIVQEGGGQWTGYVSKRLALQSGHDYLFQVQSASAKADSATKYYFTAGLPGTINEMIKINSTNSFSLPANTTKTFTFNVSGYPSSSRLGSYGRICFQTGSVTSNLDITSLKITAPNGKVLVAPSQGRYDLSKPIDYNHYLTGSSNIPLNGTWTVTIRSRAALSGLKFKIESEVEHIPGKDGNE